MPLNALHLFLLVILAMMVIASMRHSSLNRSPLLWLALGLDNMLLALVDLRKAALYHNMSYKRLAICWVVIGIIAFILAEKRRREK